MSKDKRNPSPEPKVVGTNEPNKKKPHYGGGEVIIDTSKRKRRK